MEVLQFLDGPEDFVSVDVRDVTCCIEILYTELKVLVLFVFKLTSN